MAQERLVEAAPAAVAPGDLQGRVALTLGRLDLHDSHWRDAQHRHRDRPVLIVPDLGHADLLADDGLGCHGCCVSSFSSGAVADAPCACQRSARKLRAERLPVPARGPRGAPGARAHLLDRCRRWSPNGPGNWARLQRIHRTRPGVSSAKAPRWAPGRAVSRQRAPRAPAGTVATGPRQQGNPDPDWLLRGLDLDLDVDTRGKVETLQRVNRLRGVLDDVHEPLVNAHLEMLAAVLVLVRRPDHRIAVLVGRQRNGTTNLCLGPQHGLDDLLR